MKNLLAICCLSIAIVYITALPVSNQGEDELLSSSNEGPLDRPKRTVGILRDLFPNFSQMIDRKIQQLTRIVFRIVGRLVLTGGGGGGGGGGTSDEDDDRKVSITLPTYPPDLLDNEDEDDDTTSSSSGASADGDSTTTETPDGEENSVAESRVNPVRAKREAPKQDLEEEEEDEGEDLESEATGDNEVSEDNDAESSEIDGEEEDEEDPRNKRFLNFNLGATADAQAGGSGSGGGSGNFLFDIIRLVAGSGQAPEGDGAATANVAVEEPKDETAYGVGVPGPLTRLFVVANKGVASLIQDLILRLAQTSEKIVNFKARLITSII